MRTHRGPERLKGELVVDQGPDRAGELLEQRLVQPLLRIQGDKGVEEGFAARALGLFAAELAGAGRVQGDPLQDESQIWIGVLLL